MQGSRKKIACNVCYAAELHCGAAHLDGLEVLGCPAVLLLLLQVGVRVAPLGQGVA